MSRALLAAMSAHRAVTSVLLAATNAHHGHGQRVARRDAQENEVLRPKSGHERVVPLAPEIEELVVESLRDKPARTLVLARLKSLQHAAGGDLRAAIAKLSGN